MSAARRDLKLDALYRFYDRLWRIRLFEDHVQRRAAAGELPGFPQVNTSRDAAAVGHAPTWRRLVQILDGGEWLPA